MKRFLAFEYSEYYPAGGWGDFTGSFDTLEEAIGTSPTQIVDAETGKVVWGDYL